MHELKPDLSSEEKKAPVEPEPSPEPAAPASPERDHGKPTAKKHPPWFELFNLRDADPSEEDIKKLVYRQIQGDLEADAISSQHNVLFLYDSTAIARSDTDKIYDALTKTGPKKPILLILDSLGGSISAAYFIAKLCREYSAERFEAAVPRRAKSAATLICCGADRIHMGSLSELGPIDPQFEGVPALALKHSIEHLAELAKRYPAASDMFAGYLARSLRIEALGHYERVAESAADYATRLLKSRRTVDRSDEEIKGIAERLVYKYKDHSFAIDNNEAIEIFGRDVVQFSSSQYELANRIYRSLDILEWILEKHFDRRFSFTGSATEACSIYRIRPA